MVAGGVCGCWGAGVWLLGGHAWLSGACMVAGGLHGCQGVVCGCRGACMVAGGACVVVRGHVWQREAYNTLWLIVRDVFEKLINIHV